MTISGIRGAPVPMPADDRSSGSERERLRQASGLLESEFVATLFRAMRETVPQESTGSDGPGGDVFWSMLEREVADRFALAGGFGLGRTVEQSLEALVPVPRAERMVETRRIEPAAPLPSLRRSGESE